MSFETKRQYLDKEKPHHIFSQNKGAAQFNKFFYIRHGVVIGFDPDKYSLSIRWPEEGGRENIPISFPYAGPASMIGGIPENGSVGLFGFYNNGDGFGNPIALAFIPTGMANGIEYNRVKIMPDVIPNDDVNIVQYRFRKLSQGDMIMTAPSGSVLLLNNDIELADSMRDMIMIREGDQAIISTSLNNYIFADGASVTTGRAIRNGLVLFDKDGNKAVGSNGSLLTLPGGKNMTFIVPHGESIKSNTQYYTEYRVDVDEFGDGRLDLNDINSETNITKRDPIVRMVLGNYIGADSVDTKTYGQVLKAQLFGNLKDPKSYGLNLSKANQNNAIDEQTSIALTYALHFLKSGAFVGFDKEGHHYLNLPASRANPLGSGRSMSILAQGNLKEVWGTAASDLNSWDLMTKGGIRWDLGAHNKQEKSRSISISADKGMFLEISGPDDEGYAKNASYTGNTVETVSGKVTENFTNYDLVVHGLKSENIGGAATLTYQGDKTISVSGIDTENVITEKKCNFGKRTETIKGNDSKTVVRGDISETITSFGKRSTSIFAGSIEDSIITGSRVFSIKGGNFKVDISAGGIDIKTLAGLVNISGTTVTINGTAMTSIKSPVVRIGRNAPFGGVVTGLPGIPSHLDYVTGAPLKGSNSVGAAP